MNSETFTYLCVSVHCSCFSFDPQIVLPLVIGRPYQLVPMSFVFFFFLIFGCTGSSMLHEGFLSLQQVGATLVAVHGLLITGASLIAEHRFQVHGLQELQHMSSVVVGSRPQSMWAPAVVVHGHSSSSMTCAVFPDQGSNPCALNLQADSYPLYHLGRSPVSF